MKAYTDAADITQEETDTLQDWDNALSAVHITYSTHGMEEQATTCLARIDEIRREIHRRTPCIYKVGQKVWLMPIEEPILKGNITEDYPLGCSDFVKVSWFDEDSGTCYGSYSLNRVAARGSIIRPSHD